MAKKYLNPRLKKHRLQPETHDLEQLAAAIRGGNHVALAQGITLVESTRKADVIQANALLSLLCKDHVNHKSLRIAISGSPGAGKSSLIEASLQEQEDKRVAILTIDPSSSSSKGSILGDKTRMESLVQKPNVFIRPSAAGMTLGGVHDRTQETILLCEAAGFDYVVIETVGVGQSETAVSQMVDVFVLLILAGSGDEVQGIKRGIMELADIIAVTKSDGDRVLIAKQSVQSFRHAMHLFRPKIPGWQIPVFPCSIIDRTNIAYLWEQIEKFDRFITDSGRKSAVRQEQLLAWYELKLHQVLVQRYLEQPALIDMINSQKELLADGYAEVWKLLADVRGM